MPKMTLQEPQNEKRRPMPGDRLVPEAIAMLTNGVTIKARLENVWPWIVQIGSGRAGWYAYDWIDNGGQPSATTLRAEHQHLAPGDIVPALPGMQEAFCVAMVDPPRDLVLTVPDATGGHQVSYEFLLEPLDLNRTRLIVRGRISGSWPAAAQATAPSTQPPAFIERVYGVLARIPRPLKLALAFFGHHLMESRMLRGVKRRAERAASGAVG